MSDSIIFLEFLGVNPKIFDVFITTSSIVYSPVKISFRFLKFPEGSCIVFDMHCVIDPIMNLLFLIFIIE